MPHALLANAIAGRVLPTRWHDHEHGRAYFDGHALCVSRSSDVAGAQQVIVQAALVRAGSFDPAVIRGLIGRPALARRYLWLEVARALALISDALPRALLRHPDLQALPAPSEDAQRSLERARREGGRAELPRLFGTLRPARVARLGDRAVDANRAVAAGGLPRRDAADADELEDSRILDAMRSPLGRASDLFDVLLRQLLGGGFSRSDEKGAGAGDASSGHAGGALGGRRASRTDAPMWEGSDDAGGRGRLYPEWDASKRRYRPAHVCVAEVDPEAERTQEPRAHALRQRVLTRALARVTVSHTRQRAQPQGDSLDLDAVVRWRLERASSTPGVYQQIRRARHDLGVLVLADITGSSADTTADGARIFDAHMDVALTLTRSLRECGNRAALYGFHSWGAKLVRLQRVVDFDDAWDAAALGRAQAIAPAGYSRLGAAVRHGCWSLQQRSGTPYRLLVMVSDGIAYDRGYEGAYGRLDTRMALREARGAGVGCVCISVGSGADPAQLRTLFGAAHHLSVPHVLGMERPLAMVMARAARQAGHRRALTRRPH